MTAAPDTVESLTNVKGTRGRACVKANTGEKRPLPMSTRSPTRKSAIWTTEPVSSVMTAEAGKHTALDDDDDDAVAVAVAVEVDVAAVVSAAVDLVQVTSPVGTESGSPGWLRLITRSGASPTDHVQHGSPSSCPLVNPSLSESV